MKLYSFIIIEKVRRKKKQWREENGLYRVYHASFEYSIGLMGMIENIRTKNVSKLIDIIYQHAMGHQKQ